MPLVQDGTQQGRVMAGLQELYDEGELTDVTLKAGTEEVYCHRCVLVTAGPYFRAMFTNDLRESHEETVELQNVPPALLEPVIDYIYYGTIEIEQDTVQDLLGVANLLQLTELIDLCAKYMVQEIHVSNCVGLYLVGQRYNNSHIITNAEQAIRKHFTAVAETGDLNLLDSKEFQSFLADDDLDIRSEEVTFNSMVKWVEHDLAGRKKHLPDLVGCIRLGLLSEDFMTSVVENCDLVMKDSFSRSIINLARLQVVAGGTVGFDDEDAESKANKHRYGMYCAALVTFVGASKDKDTLGLGCFDPKTLKNYYGIQPHISFDYTNRVDHHRVVVTNNNEIFVVGGVLFENYELGETSGKALDSITLYDPDFKNWLQAKPMLEGRCAHGLVALENLIFAIGGKSRYPNGEPLSSVEIYNIDRNRWSYAPDLPFGLCHHQALAYRDKVIVVGGSKAGNVASSAILIFDPLEATWETFTTRLEYPRTMFAAALRQDELYIAGGTNGDVKLSTVEIINLETLKWSRAAFFPEERRFPCMFVYDGDVYLCGGLRTIYMRMTGEMKEMMSRDLWRYNSSEDSWVQVAKLLPYANTHACVVAEHNFKKLTESDFISKV